MLSDAQGAKKMRKDTVAKGREDGTQITPLSFTCSHRDSRVSARTETSHKRPCIE